jgi:hypothetical protein
MRSPTAPLPVTDEQRLVLEKVIRSRTAPIVMSSVPALC